ncbi:DUF1302 domain-containing protein [bacterium]|nr:DUF1302 domain-containing protein [bacterium]
MRLLPQTTLFCRSVVSRSCLSFLLTSLLVSLPAGAKELDFGDDSELEGSFDTTLSLGTTIRAQSRDESIIGRQNGGTGNSINGDNGNLNYDHGDVTSVVGSITNELDLSYDRTSLFIRTFGFWDWMVMTQGTERTSFSPSAERFAGGDFRLLDAYVTQDFNIGDEGALTIRAGQQVINWGESTFIPNGLISINPVDVTRLRTAGAALQNALIPMPAIDFNYSVDENLSFEAFYQFRFDHTDLEPEGTFFSTTDIASPGGNTVLLGFGAPGIPDNPAPYGLGVAGPVGIAVARGSDRDAGNQGQFGLAARWFVPELNDTEFGLYWTHVHSRVPLIGAVTGSLAGLGAGDYAASAEYFIEYPEDINTIGASFNTQVGSEGTAIQGEFIYRFDQPLQKDDVELLFAALTPLNPVFGANQVGSFGFDETIQGYIERDMIQGQVTVTQLTGPWAGADQWVMLAEAGFSYFRDFPDKDELRLEGPGTYTTGNPFFTAAGIQPETETDGFADKFSWGYRLVTRADFNNAIAAWNIRPSLAFQHDKGTSPAPITNFVDDRKTITGTVAADYLNRYQVGVSYTNFFDGGRYNLLRDRDFVSIFGSVFF